MNIDAQIFKVKLLDEKTILERELGEVGVVDRTNPAEWDAAEKALSDENPSDRTETADAITEYEANTAVVSVLNKQLGETIAALERIENGAFGICQTCNQPIEIARLNANPSARTCILHMNDRV